MALNRRDSERNPSPSGVNLILPVREDRGTDADRLAFDLSVESLFELGLSEG